MKNAFKKLVLLTALLTLGSSVYAKTTSPREVAEKYFEAFDKHDAATMGSLYKASQTDVFEDPMFGKLSTKEAKAMWQMLLINPIDYSVEYEIVKVINSIVVVNWTARYKFSQTKMPVVNEGVSVLKIRNGKITQQTDLFDLCGWFKMAFPAPNAQVFCAKPEAFQNILKAKLAEVLNATK